MIDPDSVRYAIASIRDSAKDILYMTRDYRIEDFTDEDEIEDLHHNIDCEAENIKAWLQDLE